MSHNDLETLKRHCKDLLLAEIAALLHDVGKLSSQFIDQMSRSPSTRSNGFAHENAVVQIRDFVDKQFLTALQDTKLRDRLRWAQIPSNERIGRLLDLILHHDKSSHSAFLVRLLNRCDGFDSGADKGTTRQQGLPETAKQEKYDNTFIASAFGYESRLDEAKLDTARGQLTRACYAPQRYTWYAFSMTRNPYPSDGSDEERAFVAPSLTCMTEDVPQRDHSLREVLNGVRRIGRTGAPWRLMPNAPPLRAVGRRRSANPAPAEGRGRCDPRL